MSALTAEPGTAGNVPRFKIRSDIGYSINDYDFSRDARQYDDRLLEQAEKNVQKTWDLDWRMPWWSPLDWNTCQDYACAVKREYNRLEGNNTEINC